jgi:hypothetical protein
MRLDPMRQALVVVPVVFFEGVLVLRPRSVADFYRTTAALPAA